MSAANLNVSGADALLIDNGNSFFQHAGYTRTSNFQFKLKELDPVNVAKFGATTTFKVHKQDHLLGPVDLKMKLALPAASAVGGVPQFFTNKIGYAMIDRVRFLVGSNLIQEIDGEWLEMENSLYAENPEIDTIGDARKRPAEHNKPLSLTLNQYEGFDYHATSVESTLQTAAATKAGGITAVDADRGIYEFNSEEYYGSVPPLMAETNAANTVQGRAKVTSRGYAATTIGSSVADVMPAPPAMPAFTGNFDYVGAHEHDGATGTFQHTDDTLKVASKVCGQPATFELTVPLGLFFTKHPSMYLPILAVGASQDITIEIKLRDVHELLQHWHVTETGAASSGLTNVNDITGPESAALFQTAKPQGSTSSSGFKASAVPTISSMQLFCHYYALSAPEANALMAKPQHVRLIKQVQSLENTEVTIPGTYVNDQTFATKTEFKIDLDFLHPTQTIWIAIRDPDDIANFEYFRYLGEPGDECRVEKWDLVINGQSRHATKTESDYAVQRLVPLHHGYRSPKSFGVKDRSPLIPIDFALNAQSNNPSGHLNLTNAATKQLKLDIKGIAGKQYRVDLYAVNSNWVNMSNGTARVVFN